MSSCIDSSFFWCLLTNMWLWLFFILYSPMHHKFLDLNFNISSEWKFLYLLGFINLQLWWWRKSSLTFIACKEAILSIFFASQAGSRCFIFYSMLPQFKYYLHFSLLHIVRPSLIGRDNNLLLCKQKLTVILLKLLQSGLNYCLIDEPEQLITLNTDQTM